MPSLKVFARSDFLVSPSLDKYDKLFNLKVHSLITASKPMHFPCLSVSVWMNAHIHVCAISWANILQCKHTHTHTLRFSVIASGSSQTCHLRVCLLILPVIFKEQIVWRLASVLHYYCNVCFPFCTLLLCSAPFRPFGSSHVSAIQ